MKSLGRELFESYNKGACSRKKIKQHSESFPIKQWLDMNDLERTYWEQIATNPQFVSRVN